MISVSTPYALFSNRCSRVPVSPLLLTPYLQCKTTFSHNKEQSTDTTNTLDKYVTNLSHPRSDCSPIFDCVLQTMYERNLHWYEDLDLVSKFNIITCRCGFSDNGSKFKTIKSINSIISQCCKSSDLCHWQQWLRLQGLWWFMRNQLDLNTYNSLKTNHEWTCLVLSKHLVPIARLDILEYSRGNGYFSSDWQLDLYSSSICDLLQFEIENNHCDVSSQFQTKFNQNKLLLLFNGLKTYYDSLLNLNICNAKKRKDINCNDPRYRQLDHSVFQMQRKMNYLDYVLRFKSSKSLPNNARAHIPKSNVKCTEFLKNSVKTSLSVSALKTDVSGVQCENVFECLAPNSLITSTETVLNENVSVASDQKDIKIAGTTCLECLSIYDVKHGQSDTLDDALCADTINPNFESREWESECFGVCSNVCYDDCSINNLDETFYLSCLDSNESQNDCNVLVRDNLEMMAENTSNLEWELDCFGIDSFCVKTDSKNVFEIDCVKNSLESDHCECACVASRYVTELNTTNTDGANDFICNEDCMITSDACFEMCESIGTSCVENISLETMETFDASDFAVSNDVVVSSDYANADTDVICHDPICVFGGAFSFMLNFVTICVVILLCASSTSATVDVVFDVSSEGLSLHDDTTCDVLFGLEMNFLDLSCYDFQDGLQRDLFYYEDCCGLVCCGFDSYGLNCYGLDLDLPRHQMQFLEWSKIDINFAYHVLESVGVYVDPSLVYTENTNWNGWQHVHCMLEDVYLSDYFPAGSSVNSFGSRDQTNAGLTENASNERDSNVSGYLVCNKNGNLNTLLQFLSIICLCDNVLETVDLCCSVKYIYWDCDQLGYLEERSSEACCHQDDAFYYSLDDLNVFDNISDETVHKMDFNGMELQDECIFLTFAGNIGCFHASYDCSCRLELCFRVQSGLKHSLCDFILSDLDLCFDLSQLCTYVCRKAMSGLHDLELFCFDFLGVGNAHCCCSRANVICDAFIYFRSDLCSDFCLSSKLQYFSLHKDIICDFEISCFCPSDSTVLMFEVDVRSSDWCVEGTVQNKCVTEDFDIHSFTVTSDQDSYVHGIFSKPFGFMSSSDFCFCLQSALETLSWCKDTLSSLSMMCRSTSLSKSCFDLVEISLCSNLFTTCAFVDSRVCGQLFLNCLYFCSNHMQIFYYDVLDSNGYVTASNGFCAAWIWKINDIDRSDGIFQSWWPLYLLFSDS